MNTGSKLFLTGHRRDHRYIGFVATPADTLLLRNDVVSLSPPYSTLQIEYADVKWYAAPQEWWLL